MSRRGPIKRAWWLWRIGIVNSRRIIKFATSEAHRKRKGIASFIALLSTKRRARGVSHHQPIFEAFQIINESQTPSEKQIVTLLKSSTSPKANMVDRRIVRPKTRRVISIIQAKACMIYSDAATSSWGAPRIIPIEQNSINKSSCVAEAHQRAPIMKRNRQSGNVGR